MYSISLALLVIVAGMFLLAKTAKENLGKFFKAISYFVIISGFLLIFGSIVCGAVHMKMRHEHRGFQREMFMRGRGGEGGGMMMERRFRFEGNDDHQMDFHNRHHEGFRNRMDSDRVARTQMDSDKVMNQ